MTAYDAARKEILDWVAVTVGKPTENIDLSMPFPDLGLDSLDAVHMLATIESLLGQELPEDIMRRVTCLNDIFDMMREKLAAA
jgi:acyl carrier protein